MAAPTTKPAPAPKDKAKQTVTETKDSLREIVETIVFVVVLVLLLKSFVAEAFVIPTGSMAETLWGYQKDVTCPVCGHEFPVNCSSEVDPQQENQRDNVIGCTCPNCRFAINFAEENRINPNFKIPAWNTGDRVLVAKFPYDSHLSPPHRHDVVVFKYPKEPQHNYVPWNYIKRLIGLPGETIAIHYGKLYVLAPGKSPHYDDSQVPPQDLWQEPYMHTDDPRAVDLFNNGAFTIIRKSPSKILAMRRIVYDNDHPARDLEGKVLSRWSGKDAAVWTPEGNGFRHSGSSSEPINWLRYQHLIVPRGRRGEINGPVRPQLITDFMGYNTGVLERGQRSHPNPNWVGDLILECEVTIDQPQGQLAFELSKGVDRFQARWDLTSGICTFFRLTGSTEEKLESQPTALKAKGTYKVRFANVDERLMVWVNGNLPFGEGVVYSAAKAAGPDANDLQPASIGVQGANVAINRLQLWRDTYYTLSPASSPGQADAQINDGDWGNPDAWNPLRQLGTKTLYVQPGHYLCLGDNSPESSDGRSWGLVPERLMLGRALMVYWPYGRLGPIK